MADDPYFKLDELLDKTIEAVTTSSLHLTETFENEQWRDVPFVYTIPKFSVSVAISLSYKDGFMHGAFSRKTTQETAESRISFDVVALPHSLPSPDDRVRIAGTLTDIHSDPAHPQVLKYPVRYSIRKADGVVVQLYASKDLPGFSKGKKVTAYYELKDGLCILSEIRLEK